MIFTISCFLFLGVEISRTPAGSSELSVLCRGRCLLCLRSGALVILRLVFPFRLLICKLRNLCFAGPSSRLFSKCSCVSLPRKKRVVGAPEGGELCAPRLALSFARGVQIRVKTCRSRGVALPAIPASPLLRSFVRFQY